MDQVCSLCEQPIVAHEEYAPLGFDAETTANAHCISKPEVSPEMGNVAGCIRALARRVAAMETSFSSGL